MLIQNSNYNLVEKAELKNCHIYPDGNVILQAGSPLSYFTLLHSLQLLEWNKLHGTGRDAVVVSNYRNQRPHYHTMPSLYYVYSPDTLWSTEMLLFILKLRNKQKRFSPNKLKVEHQGIRQFFSCIQCLGYVPTNKFNCLNRHTKGHT